MKMNKRQFQDSLWYIIIRPDFTSEFNQRPPDVPNVFDFAGTFSVQRQN